jgi:hypothetical protein
MGKDPGEPFRPNEETSPRPIYSFPEPVPFSLLSSLTGGTLPSARGRLLPWNENSAGAVSSPINSPLKSHSLPALIDA